MQQRIFAWSSSPLRGVEPVALVPHPANPTLLVFKASPSAVLKMIKILE